MNVIATAPEGLEKYLAKEIIDLGGFNTDCYKRSVSFECDYATFYRIHFFSRIAFRFYRVITRFPCHDKQSLYHGIRDSFDWLKWLPSEKTFNVQVTGRTSTLSHSHFTALEVKNSITDLQQSESVSANGSDFIVPGLINVKNTAAQSNGYGFSEKKITSAFGSAELGFKDFAYLTVTARNDWFSTLSLAGKNAPNNDLYTSASFSLVLSDALDLGDTVSFFKVRAGISEVAGGADNPYALSLTYGITGQGHLGASLGQINGGQIPNSEITPFQKNETEFGFDLRMLDNRLSFCLLYTSDAADE